MKKVLIIIILVVILSGVLLAAASYVNVFQDESGFHIVPKSASEIYADMDVRHFKAVEIKTDVSNIEFITADDFGFEFMANSAVETVYTNENGKLTITQDSKNLLFNFHFSSGKRDYIKIYLPDDASLENVSIKSLSGNVTINGLRSEKLNISSTSGNAVINDTLVPVVVIDKTSGNLDMAGCKAGSFEIKMISGNFNASKIESGAMKVNMTSGNATLAGKLIGDSVATTVSGNINLKITGEKNAYNRDISVVSGTVHVDGAQTKSDKYENAAATNSLTLKTTSGNVTVNFTN